MGGMLRVQGLRGVAVRKGGQGERVLRKCRKGRKQPSHSMQHRLPAQRCGAPLTSATGPR